MMLATGQNERRGAGGFTLVELILVMVLLVVLVSMISPNLSGFVRGRALESEAGRIIALMHAAQSRAISEGVPLVFWVDAKQGQYGMSEETPQNAAGDPKAEQVQAADSLQVSVVTTGVGAMIMFHNLPAIRFLPDGSVDENSPPALQVTSAYGGSLLVSEMKNKMGYEIREVSN